MIRAMALAAALMPCLGAAAQTLPACPERAPAGMADFVDGLMTAAMKQTRDAGAAVAIVKDGCLALSAAYGLADASAGRPVGADTLFRMGSISKLVTWTAAMQLAEAGRLDLDADVNRYLDFEIPERFGAPVTMRNLMSHTAGFEDRFIGMWSEHPERLAGLGAFLRTHVPARVAAPGAQVSYSNYGAALAGYIVQRVSGEDFDDYVERRVFGPLGMTRSTFREPPPAGWDVSRGHVVADGAWRVAPEEHISDTGPAGAMRATAGDVARFMAAHLNDGALGDARILRPETARLMRERLAGFDPRLPGVAHGFVEVERPGPHRVIGHGGTTRYFFSDLQLVPDARLGVAVMFNTVGASPARNTVISQIIDRWLGPAAAEAPATTATAAADDYAGFYRTDRRAWTNAEAAFAIDDGATVSAGPDGALSIDAGGRVLPLSPVEPDVFAFDGRAQAGMTAGRAIFHRDAAGRVASLGLSSSPTAVFERTGRLDSPAAIRAAAIACEASFALFLGAAVWRRRRGGLFTALASGFCAAFLAAGAIFETGLSALAEGWPDGSPPALAWLAGAGDAGIALLIAAGAAFALDPRRGPTIGRAAILCAGAVFAGLLVTYHLTWL